MVIEKFNKEVVEILEVFVMMMILGFNGLNSVFFIILLKDWSECICE